jgi:Raf kinase inhibitor-like YbhB/YbcL family protein
MSGLQLTSPAFADGEPIPLRHTRDGQDCSPPLAWSGVPSGTASFALVCEDPDAPGRTWVHWVLYRIPAGVRALQGGIPRQEEVVSTGLQGRNDFGFVGYGGPSPPVGPSHRYQFRLYALSQDVPLPAGLAKHQVLEAVHRFVIARARLTGRYRRA